MQVFVFLTGDMDIWLGHVIPYDLELYFLCMFIFTVAKIGYIV